MIGLQERNQAGLTDEQVEKVAEAWAYLCQTEGEDIPIDFSRAREHSSLTAYSEKDGKVYIGADVYQGKGTSARARMSYFACLAHELSHAQRHRRGYDRPSSFPDMLRDEAETSLNASFMSVTREDRFTLVEDAGDRIRQWLYLMKEKENAES